MVMENPSVVVVVLVVAAEEDLSLSMMIGIGWMTNVEDVDGPGCMERRPNVIIVTAVRNPSINCRRCGRDCRSRLRFG